MNKEGFRNLIRDAFHDREKEREAREDQELQECSSEDIFFYYLGLLHSNLDKERIEGHIASCACCRHLVITLSRLENERKKGQDDEIIQALNNIGEKISLSLAWAKERLILEKTNIESLYYWNAITSVLVPSRNGVRDGIQGERRELPPFIQSFAKCKVIIKIREEGEGRCEIYCRIIPNVKRQESKKQGFIKREVKIQGSEKQDSMKQKIVLPINVDLVRAGRRFRSLCLKNESAIFERIEPGNYLLIVREKETHIAEILLDIKI